MTRHKTRKPCTCNGGRSTVHFAGFTARSDDFDETPRRPVWECGNCGDEKPRRVRRTKREMALARVRAKYGDGR